MAFLIKKIGGREYAYHAYRQGGKVVHKYLGSASNPQVMQKMQETAEEKEIPDKFLSLFWDAETSGIDIKKNARYIIERILEIGGMDAVQWIQRIYPTRLVVEVCESSRKVSERPQNFWRIWFGYKNMHTKCLPPQAQKLLATLKNIAHKYNFVFMNLMI